MVAPFAGAWIEMKKWLHGKLMLQSLPSRERGLKSPIENDNSGKLSSLPSRERGLKFLKLEISFLRNSVAPFAGAWIEIDESESED